MFKKQTFLDLHFKVHHEGKGDHICHHCGHLTISKHCLQVHIKLVHEGQKDHICKECKKGFGLKASLKKHIETVHEKQRKYICPTCQKGFGTKLCVITHLLAIHHGLKYAKRKLKGTEYQAKLMNNLDLLVDEKYMSNLINSMKNI